jgi:hypothetical protein
VTNLNDRERQIIQQIISELGLELEANAQLEEVIAKIKELIGKPDVISQAVNNEELDNLRGLVQQKEIFINSLKKDLANSKQELSATQQTKNQALHLNLLLGIILLFSYLFFLSRARKSNKKRLP